MLGTKASWCSKSILGSDFRKCWYAKLKIEHSSSSAGGFDKVSGPVSVPRAGCLIVAVVEEAEPPL